MKKLHYVTDALAIHGGLERVLIDKANWLSTYGDYEVHILTTNQGNHPLPFSLNDKVFFEDLKIGFNHQYSYTGIKRLIFVIKLQKLFRKCLYEKFEEIKPDVVVCVRQEFVADIIKVRKNIPLVFESHSSRNSYSFDNSTFFCDNAVTRVDIDVNEGETKVTFAKINIVNNRILLPCTAIRVIKRTSLNELTIEIQNIDKQLINNQLEKISIIILDLINNNERKKLDRFAINLEGSAQMTIRNGGGSPLDSPLTTMSYNNQVIFQNDSPSYIIEFSDVGQNK